MKRRVGALAAARRDPSADPQRPRVPSLSRATTLQKLMRYLRTRTARENLAAFLRFLWNALIALVQHIRDPYPFALGVGNEPAPPPTRGSAQPPADRGDSAAPSPPMAIAARPVHGERGTKWGTLVLDLDETLIHSSTTFRPNADMTLNVLLNGRYCTFWVFKRPCVDFFLQQVCQWYEVIIFTASLRAYATPLLNELDPGRQIAARYFRDACTAYRGNYVKNLGVLQRDLSRTLIVDNSPVAYSFHKVNALPVKAWMADNPHDRVLLDLISFLSALRFTNDVRSVLGLRLGQPGATPRR